MGLLRTRLDAILPAARIGGRSLPLAPELFSITAYARLALGQISQERYSCDSADGAGKDRQEARRRLARSVCTDHEEIRDRGWRSPSHCREGLSEVEGHFSRSNSQAGGKARPGAASGRTMMVSSEDICKASVVWFDLRGWVFTAIQVSRL
jgi:hypothetical protein